ncbi:MAG: hypothetical protein J5753_01870 [Oscillospiraceae bacterium]|nr:hypothetical protein [Oscillospiraceae bacterium]
MVEMKFEGKTYRRYNGNWIDSDYVIAPLVVQEALDKRYANSLSLEHYSVKDLVALADDFKNNESYLLAEKYYREALSRPSIESNDRKYIYPRLTSCLRLLDRSSEVVDIYLEISGKYGRSILTDGLLTSVAAAYCDLKQYDEARKRADQAYAIVNGKASPELISVYARIRKHTEK